MRTQHEIDVAFHAYDERNPDIYAMFKRFAYEALMSGHHHFGAKAVMERVRWETAVRAKGGTFKINNDYTSRYARKLIAEKPEFDGFFRLRRLH
jgi:hypothetical protein